MELQESVFTRLTNLKSHDDAAKLFSTLLNYDYSAQSLSLKRFPSSQDGRIKQLQILAGHDDFKVLHCEVNQLLLGVERSIINNLLRDHPYSLFLFSDSLKQQWHFINVKYDEDENRRKIFRRIVIGPDERLHTAAQRIAMLEVPDARKLSPLELQQRHDEAFDVEAVTKDFFKSFVTMFHQLQDEIDELNPRYVEKSAEFSQMLLNRIMFLYFIQKKGWLNGNKNYLFEHFKKGFHTQPEKQTFYTDVVLRVFQRLALLEPLYKELGDIPFLNGGLFEINDWEPTLKVRNKMFGRMFKDLFEHYNFTVREDTAMDMEVAIDPEMLGKVFENLILTLERDPKTDLRKATGSYYTPRVIVHFMCQQSLKEYLIENAYYPEGFGLRKDVLPFTNSAYEKTTKQATLNVPQQDVLKKQIREKIEKLFTLNPASQLTEEELTWLRSSFTPQEAEQMKHLVLQCRVCDPAVGSGAFVVGMLHEMLAVIKLFDLVLKGTKEIQQKNYDYQLKRKIIENCLYGVDIQEQAVRICELRLWLSLVVDYEGKDIPPLPNLSYRIQRGNSLIDQLFGYNVNLNLKQGTAQAEKVKQLVDSIQADKHAYFYESDVKKKRKAETNILTKQCDLASFYLKLWQDQVVEEYEAKYSKGFFSEHKLKKAEEEERDALKREIKELDRLLLLAKNTKEKLIAIEKGKLKETEHTRLLEDTFVWKLDFAEIFKEKDGFDIVIANPPYVSFGLRGNKKAEDHFSDIVRKLYAGSAEYKISYYALFMELAIKLACKQAVICYITPDSFLLGRYFSKLRRTILDTAAIIQMVMFEKDFWKSGVVGRPTISLMHRGKPGDQVTAILCKDDESLFQGQLLMHRYSQSYFESMPYNRFRLFFSQFSMDYVRNIETSSEPLKVFSRITTGVRSKSGQDKVVSNEKKGPKWKKGITSGSQVIPYKVCWDGKYLNIDSQLLFSGGWDAKIVERPKIMIRQTGDTIIAAIDRDDLYHLNNVHSLSPLRPEISLPYLCAILNSRMMNRYYHLISLEKGRAMAQTDIETLDLLPIRQADESIVKNIEKQVENIEKPGVREQIDNTIESIYGLTQEFRLYLERKNLYTDKD